MAVIPTNSSFKPMRFAVHLNSSVGNHGTIAMAFFAVDPDTGNTQDADWFNLNRKKIGLCPVCDGEMDLRAESSVTTAVHFWHGIGATCPSIKKNRKKYEVFPPSSIDKQAGLRLRAEVKEHLYTIYQACNAIVDGLKYAEFRDLIAKASEKGIWDYKGFRLNYVPYVLADVYRDITMSTSTPIHTGEQIYLRQNFRELIETHAVNIVGPDPADVGGMAELKWVAEYADLHGILMAPHGMVNGLLGLAALVQVSATLPMNFIAHEYPIGEPSWWYDIVEGLPDPNLVGVGHRPPMPSLAGDEVAEQCGHLFIGDGGAPEAVFDDAFVGSYELLQRKRVPHAALEGQQMPAAFRADLENPGAGGAGESRKVLSRLVDIRRQRIHVARHKQAQGRHPAPRDSDSPRCLHADARCRSTSCRTGYWARTSQPRWHSSSIARRSRAAARSARGCGCRGGSAARPRRAGQSARCSAPRTP
jgi:hypothetical protein